MQVLILLAHPSIKSFNHAIARTAVHELKKNGHSVVFHDLYKEKFDPILLADEISGEASISHEVELHCSEVSNADGIVVVHPNWWGQPPAILKGWVDKVLCPGIAYKFIDGDKGEGVPIGLLKAKTAIIFNTSNTPAEREENVFGDPLETIWKKCIFNLCGVENFYRETFNVIITSSVDQRKEWLKIVKEIINRYFPA
jgi:putative NADPH-quinone reductase